MQSAPLISNHVTIDVLQRLFFSESKPQSLRPIDVAILAYLVLRRCEDHEIFDSYLTIADRVCAEKQTVTASLKRLDRLGWVSLGGRGNGRSKAISINMEMFPAAQPLREAISADAKQIAVRYELALKKMGRRKFPKNWHVRQEPSAQRILTACDGNLELARSMIGFALHSPHFKAKAMMSLYNLLKLTGFYSRMWTA